MTTIAFLPITAEAIQRLGLSPGKTTPALSAGRLAALPLRTIDAGRDELVMMLRPRGDHG